MVGLEFEVLPESSLRNGDIELVLGTPINQVIAALQNASKVIRIAELVYCKENPFGKEVTITLKTEGIRLVFDPFSQLLKLIEVYDFKTITLKYCNNVFSTPDEQADVDKIEKCFGPTHPGVYDPQQQMYLKKWRGVFFCFPAMETSPVQPTHAHGLGSLHFANDTLPCVHRMIIFSGTDPNTPKLPEVPLVAYCGNSLLVNIQSVQEDGLITGLKFKCILEGPNSNKSKKQSDSKLVEQERIVKLGDTEEAVLAALGAPAKVFYKSDEKMLIQRGSSQVRIDQKKPDLFYNYFTLGTDVLIDHSTRRVLKFILHTNAPGHFDFATYHLCNFTIDIPNSPIVISTESKLEDFREIFQIVDDECEGQAIIKPVVLNKSSTNGGENPFGKTFCYGCKQIIAEVMPNGHISTLIVYKDVNEEVLSNDTETGNMSE